MPMKIYFLTSEITPFAETGILAQFSKHIPFRLQEKKHDIRITAPKYGFISERKYILREVIRLREIECQFGEETILVSAKSAFIPKTRVQVYFMEHDEWFQPLNPLLYKAKNGRPFSDNDHRFGFFSKTAIAMLEHLFWKPDIILCNDWQSALVPMIYEQLFKDQKFYSDIKTVQIVHNLDDYSNFSRDIFDKLGIKLPSGFDSETINATEVACHFADLIITVDSDSKKMSEELPKLLGKKSSDSKMKKKIRSLKIDDPENNGAWSDVGDEIEKILQDHFS